MFQRCIRILHVDLWLLPRGATTPPKQVPRIGTAPMRRTGPRWALARPKRMLVTMLYLTHATRWKMLRGFTAAQTNRILGPFPASRIPRYTMPKLLIDPWRDARIVCHGISDCLDAFTHLRQSYLAKITKQPTGDMIHGFVTRAKRDENVFPTLVIYLSSRASDISGQ
jgi:hypothetical protein